VLVIDDEPALCAVVRRLPRGRQEVVGLGGATQQFLRATSNPLLDKPFETRALNEAVARVLETGAVSGTWRTADVSDDVPAAV
jgi:hypothetical protein